jgi:hypothetical protein
MSAPIFVHEPETALRGSRDYVHSTDLYDQIAASVASAGLAFEGPIDFKIKARIVHRPRHTIVAAGQAMADAVATCTFTSNGQDFMVAVTETNALVTARKPYDESPAAKASHIEGREAVLAGETGLRPVEAVTALAVHLHKTALPPAAGLRWMLGQMSIRRPLAETETRTLTLAIDRTIGSTMTRTRMEAHDGVLGTIIFILAGPSV